MGVDTPIAEGWGTRRCCSYPIWRRELPGLFCPPPFEGRTVPRDALGLNETTAAIKSRDRSENVITYARVRFRSGKYQARLSQPLSPGPDRNHARGRGWL